MAATASAVAVAPAGKERPTQAMFMDKLAVAARSSQGDLTPTAAVIAVASLLANALVGGPKKLMQLGPSAEYEQSVDSVTRGVAPIPTTPPSQAVLAAATAAGGFTPEKLAAPARWRAEEPPRHRLPMGSDKQNAGTLFQRTAELASPKKPRLPGDSLERGGAAAFDLPQQMRSAEKGPVMAAERYITPGRTQSSSQQHAVVQPSVDNDVSRVSSPRADWRVGGVLEGGPLAKDETKLPATMAGAPPPLVPQLGTTAPPPTALVTIAAHVKG